MALNMPKIGLNTTQMGLNISKIGLNTFLQHAQSGSRHLQHGSQHSKVGLNTFKMQKAAKMPLLRSSGPQGDPIRGPPDTSKRVKLSKKSLVYGNHS